MQGPTTRTDRRAFVVERSLDRSTSSTEGLRSAGKASVGESGSVRRPATTSHLDGWKPPPRIKKGRGRRLLPIPRSKTRPQPRRTHQCSKMLWNGLRTVPPRRPKVSRRDGRRPPVGCMARSGDRAITHLPYKTARRPWRALGDYKLSGCGGHPRGLMFRRRIDRLALLLAGSIEVEQTIDGPDRGHH